ncbi:L,D-transpeptidase [Streptomyces sp. KLOTTS4A1]|uniref:L,D-transpeptidase n=1 Tax=Streptomyces sp. KLOTTS4A1 TaxID=3390996 RepID=UPI0039F58925
MPYAQFFSGGQAFHGRYATIYYEPGSHGCVNLSYRDAQGLWKVLRKGTPWWFTGRSRLPWSRRFGSGRASGRSSLQVWARFKPGFTSRRSEPRPMSPCPPSCPGPSDRPSTGWCGR